MGNVMKIRNQLGLALFLLGIFSAVAVAGRVQLVLEASKESPITAMQEWGRALSKAGVHDVRILHTTTKPKPKIETQVVGGQKFYTVRGTIDGSGQVVVPGATFQMGDAKQLGDWLDEVGKKGPPDQREPVDKYGLTLNMTKKVGVDLGTPITFETKGSSVADVIRRLNRQTRYPILATKTMMERLKTVKVSKELKGVAVGTVLVYLVDPFGLGLYPGEDKNGQMQYLVVKQGTQKVEPWPIGWKPKERRKAVPKLFEKKNINVDRIPIEEVLQEIAKRVEVPYLIDEAALTREKIDMGKELVSFPDKHTDYDRALGTMLGKARLKYRLLLDDAGKPFLWVTTLRDQ